MMMVMMLTMIMVMARMMMTMANMFKVWKMGVEEEASWWIRQPGSSLPSSYISPRQDHHHHHHDIDNNDGNIIITIH